MQRLTLYAAATWTLLAVAAAHAQQPTPDADRRARVHFQAATQYYDEGRFEEAVPEFREAWRLSHRPEMLLNLANAAEQALHFDQAADALDEYLQNVPTSPDREALTRRVSRDRAVAARIASGENATTAAGHEGGAATTDTHPTGAQSTVPHPHDTAEVQGPPAHTDVLPPPESHGLTGLSWAGLATLGGGAVAGIVSLILGVVAHDQYASLEAACPAHVCTTDHSADAGSGKSLALASTVLTFVALALGATGGVLLALGLGEHPQAERTTAHLEVAPGPGELGLGARVRW